MAWKTSRSAGDGRDVTSSEKASSNILTIRDRYRNGETITTAFVESTVN